MTISTFAKNLELHGSAQTPTQATGGNPHNYVYHLFYEVIKGGK